MQITSQKPLDAVKSNTPANHLDHVSFTRKAIQNEQEQLSDGAEATALGEFMGSVLAPLSISDARSLKTDSNSIEELSGILLENAAGTLQFLSISLLSMNDADVGINRKNIQGALALLSDVVALANAGSSIGQKKKRLSKYLAEQEREGEGYDDQ